MTFNELANKLDEQLKLMNLKCYYFKKHHIIT